MAERLTAGELCTSFAYKGMALTEAARLMREHHVGCLVVVDESDAGRIVVGMLTDRDIVTSVVARDVDAATLARRGRDERRPGQRTRGRFGDGCPRDAPQERGRVPVTGPRGQLIGVLAADDVLELITEELMTLVQALGGQREREQLTRP